MSIVKEGRLQIKFPKKTKTRKFDDAAHGLSHCMKAVDYIVEVNKRVIFLEIKDPDNPDAAERDRRKFIEDIQSGRLDDALKVKCRDSFLYEWASGNVKKKPIHYIVLIGSSGLSDAELLARTDALKRKIPIYGPQGRPWRKPFIAGCAVLNLSAWNKRLAEYPATRVNP